MHRTSGIYKFLLGDSEFRPYTKQGIKVLLDYINPYTCLSTDNLELSQIDKIKRNILNKNYVSLKKNHLFNTLIILEELKNYVNDKRYKSNYLVEIDQSNSGPAIYSLLVKNYLVGYNTNLLSKNVKVDLYISVYEYLDKEFSSSLLWKRYVKGKKKKISFGRDLMKSIVMK